MYELMSDVCKKPRLIISVYGGRKYFTMNEEIEKEFMDSLAEAAMTPGMHRTSSYKTTTSHTTRVLPRHMDYYIGFE